MFRQFKLRLSTFLVLVFVGQSYCYAQSGLAAKVGEVTAVEHAGEIQIQVPMEGRVVRPRTSHLNDPERAVFDFPGTAPKVRFTRVKVSRGSVIAIRTAAFDPDRQGRPVTRVVIDLNQPAKYQTRVEDGKFIISFSDSTSGGGVPTMVTKSSTAAPPKAASFPLTKPAPALERPKIEAKAAIVNPQPTIARTAIPTPPSVPAFQLQDLSIQQAGESTSFTLRFNQEPTPHVSTLSDPKRLVMDFPGAVFATGWTKPAVIRMQSGSVLSVRSAMFKQGPHPPVLRVVFDEIENVTKPKTLIDGNTVTLEFSDGTSGTPVVAARIPLPSQPQPPRVQVKQVKPEPLREPLPVEPEMATAHANLGIQPHPPVVTYNSGLLYVDAENCNLTDVLFAISEKTGAGIELPMSEGMLDRVVIRIGPGRPREVLAALLEGSPYNYLIMENADGALDKVVLQPKDFAPPPPPTSGN